MAERNDPHEIRRGIITINIPSGKTHDDTGPVKKFSIGELLPDVLPLPRIEKRTPMPDNRRNDEIWNPRLDTNDKIKKILD